jgi:hypothetical protein
MVKARAAVSFYICAAYIVRPHQGLAMFSALWRAAVPHFQGIVMASSRIVQAKVVRGRIAVSRRRQPYGAAFGDFGHLFMVRLLNGLGYV